MNSRMSSMLRLLAALAAAAPATAVALALAPNAWGQSVAAQPLPPPPYAAEAGSAPPAGAQAFDRYGAGIRQAWAAPALAAAPQGPVLSWSGKVDAPAAPGPASIRPAAYTGSRTPFMPAGYPPAAAAQPQPAAPRGWTYVPPLGQPSQPGSIYDPPPPTAATPQPAAAAAQGDAQPGGARHYSVHREYGIEPDPIPLPPQFFGATADLSQPATGDPARRSTTASGKAQNPLQPADGQ